MTDQLLNFLAGLGILGGELLLALLVLFLAWEHRKWMDLHWKRGLGFGLFCLFLGALGAIAAVLPIAQSSLQGELSNPLLWLLFLTGAGLLTCLGGLQAIWRAVVYVVAEAEWAFQGREQLISWNAQGQHKRPGVFFGLVLGCALAIITSAFFQKLQVGPPEWMLARQNSNPVSGFVLILSLSVGVSAAIVEEVLYRGVLQGWLMRLLGKRWWELGLSYVIVACAWALPHWFNTNAPVFKMGQILLLSLLLSEFTRRWGLESAIATHLGLNATALVGEFCLKASLFSA